MADSDDFTTREERRAAQEAGAIGGAVPDDGLDEAQRPLAEAGEGEAEGFELAEADLVRNASHDDGVGDPAGDAFTGETEADESGAEYAEADDAQPDER